MEEWKNNYQLRRHNLEPSFKYLHLYDTISSYIDNCVAQAMTVI